MKRLGNPFLFAMRLRADRSDKRRSQVAPSPSDADGGLQARSESRKRAALAPPCVAIKPLV